MNAPLDRLSRRPEPIGALALCLCLSWLALATPTTAQDAPVEAAPREAEASGPPGSEPPASSPSSEAQPESVAPAPAGEPKEAEPGTSADAGPAAEEGAVERTQSEGAPGTPAQATPPSSGETADAAPAPAGDGLFETSDGRQALPDEARGWAREPGIEDDDVALFLPRAVLFVPKLAFQIAMWPIVQGARLIDRWNVVEHVEDILYFDEAHEIGWSPTLVFQSGFGPTFGVKVFHKSLLGNQEELSAKAAYGGRFKQYYELSFGGDRLGGSHSWIEALARYEAESGSVFGGIGIVDDDQDGSDLDPRASNRLSYFSQERLLGLARAGYSAGDVGNVAKWGASVVVNRRSFSSSDADQTRTQDVYDVSRIVGFDDTVTTLELQLNFIADLRKSEGLDSRGGYFEVFGGSVPRMTRYEYWHYGAEIAYTLNLYNDTRLLTFRTAIEAVEGEASAIPFTDLPRLGGAERLRGYEQGRYRDRRAALGSIEYHYPIHKNVLGELFVDTGHVARDFGDLYDLDDWKIGYGGGFIIGSQSSITLRLDLSYGDGFHVFLTSDFARAFAGRGDQL